MAGGRLKKGHHRMDAAIDHFTPMGYAKADVRRVINKLLSQVYGKEGWSFLEEDCYRVVQDALFEEEEEQRRQLQLLLQAEEEEVEEGAQLEAATDEALLENNMPILPVHDEVPAVAVFGFEEVEPQLEAATDEALLENNMPILPVHDEVPAAVVFGFEEVEPQLEAATDKALLENNMPILPVHDEVPAAAVFGFEEVEPVLPLPAAARTVGTRPPCYGWISESDSDSELDCDPIQHVAKIPRAREGLPFKRKHLSRWDV